jgi:DNA-binding XRE family transcriptional regulator
MSKEIRSPRHEALRKFLKLERQKADLTQAQLAAKLGWDQTTISDIETGAKRVTALELLTLGDDISFVSTAPAAANAAAAVNLRSITKAPRAPSFSAPMASAVVPAAPSAPSIKVLHHAARCGVSASTMAGAWLDGVVWKACAPIEHADVEKDRRDRHDRDERDQHGDDAEPRQGAALRHSTR